MMMRANSIRSRRPWAGTLALAAWVGLLVFARPVVAEEDAIVDSPPGRLEFVGRNLLAKAKGVFHEWRIVESSIDLEAIEESFIVVEVALDSVDTGIKRRDRHLRDPDFFETETYPVANVRVHSARPIQIEASDEDEETDVRPLRRFSVQFDIELHGVQKTLEGEVRLIEADPAVFEGDLVIDRMVFGVGPKPSRWNPMSPKAEIPIHFRVEI